MLLSLTAAAPASGGNQSRPLNMETLSVVDGLSSNYVYAITQDRAGYMWFGTENGLDRYDGKTIRHYQHFPDNPQSLSDSRVNCLLSSADGSLLVGTEKGIAALELKNMKIKRRISLENGAPLLNIRIDGIYELRSSPDGLKESDAVNAAEKQLLALCAKAFEALQKTRCDFIELGKLLEKYEPEYAEDQNEDFGRAIEELTVSVEASLKKY